MTRSLNERSTCTGFCSSRAISSKFTMSSSRTVHLTQQVAKSLAGAHDAHLQRRDSDSGQLRHLVVPHLLAVLEQKRFSLLGTQAVQRAIDFLAPRRTVFWMLLRRTEQRRLVSHEGARTPSTSCASGSAPIDQNAKQPSAKALRIFAPRQGAVGAREGVLQRLFRILPIAEHVKRVPRVLVAISFDQFAERLRIPAQHTRDDRCVRASFQEAKT